MCLIGPCTINPNKDCFTQSNTLFTTPIKYNICINSDSIFFHIAGEIKKDKFIW
jgi:hypothetical protein